MAPRSIDMRKNQPKPKPPSFSHMDLQGNAHMVDIGGKAVQHRFAVAEGYLICSPQTIRKLRRHALPKGDVLTVAQIAGIQAAKRTDELIPMCHSLPLDSLSVEFLVKRDRIRILASASISARTGVEMEALTAVSVAALTLYDMCKAVDKSMSIEGIRLIEKIKTEAVP
jgi:cyclic pyranopterin monophosphate synthase